MRMPSAMGVSLGNRRQIQVREFFCVDGDICHHVYNIDSFLGRGYKELK